MRKPVLYSDPSCCPICESKSVFGFNRMRKYQLSDIKPTTSINFLRCENCGAEFFPLWKDDGGEHKVYPATIDEINDFLNEFVQTIKPVEVK